MKTTGNIYEILSTYLLIVVLSLLVSCTDSVFEPTHTGGDEIGEEQVTVKFKLSAPGSQLTRQTRNAADIENAIDEVRILAFVEGTYRYSVDGTITREAGQTIVTARLMTTKYPIRLYILANAAGFMGETLQSGLGETDVRRALVSAFQSGGFTSNLPMFGTVLYSGGLQATQVEPAQPVKLLRAVAALDVAKDDAVSNFEIVSLQAFRASNMVQLVPSNWSNDETPHVTRPYVPHYSTKSIRTRQVVKKHTAPGGLTLYLPESTAPGQSGNINDATCLVVGGFYNNSTDTTYYRVDIPEDMNGGNIMRNYRYQFKIITVLAPGLNTPEEAADNSSTSITAIVTNWEENHEYMAFDGEKYFSISERTLRLPFRKHTDNLEVITSLENFTLQWCDPNGEPLPNAPVAENINNGLFEIKIVTDDGNKSIQVTTLSDNTTNGDREVYFLIHADPWDIKIQVTQESSMSNNRQYINILTFGLGIGGFGGTFPGNTNNGDATAVRNLLENTDNFGPGGTVPVGYVMFDYITNRTADDDVMDAFLSKYDVINVAYSLNINQSEVNAILRWLNASPHRVLIYAYDGPAYNHRLWQTLFPEKPAWNGSGGSGYVHLPGFTRENQYFTKTGPFGPIVATDPQSVTVRIADGVWMGMYPDGYTGLIPLLEWSDGVRLLLAVDPQRRIVYCGDSSMWQGRNNGWKAGGVVDNDQMRLLANLWAWIIEEIVLPGKI